MRFVRSSFLRYRFVRYKFRFVRCRYPQQTFCLSPRRLEDVFSVTIFHLARRFQDIFKTSLQDVFKTSWKSKNCYAEDVLKTSSRNVLETFSRSLQDQQMFAGTSLTVFGEAYFNFGELQVE